MHSFIKNIFSSDNNKEFFNIVNEINSLESEVSNFTDLEIKQKFKELKENKSTDKIFIFSLIREASKRVLELRHYDVQLMAGLVLIGGNLAEMATGEGKTLVSSLVCCYNFIQDRKTHIITVNDYLSQRDMNYLAPLFNFFNISFSNICIKDEDNIIAMKKLAYSSDVVFGTNNEFVFDYLNDNMAKNHSEVVQSDLDFVLIDEADSILIDEARTPVIISGLYKKDFSNDFKKIFNIIHHLQEDIDFEILKKEKNVILTDLGINKIEKLLSIDNLYSRENQHLVHIIAQILRASFVFYKDVDYIVKNDKIIIIDEFTGRLTPEVRYSNGLHQALEIKENVLIKPETQTIATTTYQSYFKLYKTISGMSGTICSDSVEFLDIYNLNCYKIPLNKPKQITKLPDIIFKNKDLKYQFIAKKVKDINKTGQPVLIGTPSVEETEVLSSYLKKEDLNFVVLNAKNHYEEASIISNAGNKGNIVISTNIAGRGVDIKTTDEVEDLGGLFVIGSERYDSRRIDNQLLGRTGRQGNKGTILFCSSLEDQLLKYYGSDKLSSFMENSSFKNIEQVNSPLISKQINKAQKKIENLYYEERKRLFEYDIVLDQQRNIIYKFRKEVLINDLSFIEDKFQEYLIVSIKSLLNSCNIIENSFYNEYYNINRLISLLKSNLNIQFLEKDLIERDFEDLLFFIKGVLLDFRKIKYESFNLKEEQYLDIEQQVFLETIDSLWIEHLYNIDTLKEGINLRQINQKDPLIEFKRESYKDFETLLEDIKISFSINVLKLSFKKV